MSQTMKGGLKSIIGFGEDNGILRTPKERLKDLGISSALQQAVESNVGPERRLWPWKVFDIADDFVDGQKQDVIFTQELNEILKPAKSEGRG